MMGQKPDAKLTPEIARELCQRTGSAAVLDGSIARLGSQYVLSLKAVNCSNGNRWRAGSLRRATKSMCSMPGKGSLEDSQQTGRIAQHGAEVRYAA